jgi:hypothetical protein
MKLGFGKQNEEEIKGLFDTLRNMAMWIKNNASLLLNLAKAAAATFAIFKGAQIAVTLFKGIYYAVVQVQGAMALAASEGATFSAVMSATPWGAIAAGIGLLVGGYMALKGAAEDARRAREEVQQKKEDTWVEEEKSKVEDLIDQYITLHKVSEQAARAAVIAAELQQYSAKSTGYTVTATGAKGESLNDTDKINSILKYLQSASKEMDRQQKRMGNINSSEPDLGSGISEPKASKIQNVTINISNPFQNMKLSAATMGMAIDDLENRFTQFLDSIALDATLTAHE